MSIKLDKNFWTQLSGSVNESFFVENEKMKSLFDLVNTHSTDKQIDLKEITAFANTIFQADSNHDGEVSKRELRMFVRENETLFAEKNIKAKDILEFFNVFIENSVKSDDGSQRTDNNGGSFFEVEAENSLENIKKLIEEPFSNKTLSILMNCDADLIKMLAKEGDLEFQKTYITGSVSKLIELANILNIDTSELTNIKEQIDREGFESVSIEDIHVAYSTTFEKIKRINFSIDHSQIKNDYYSSEYRFNTIITDDEIIIVNLENNKKNIINLANLLEPFNAKEKSMILMRLKDIPAEVLLDMSIEATFHDGSVSRGTDGQFNFVLDEIILSGGDYSKRTIIHELGHAIDCVGKGFDSYNTNSSKEFNQIFERELAQYIAQGNARCTQEETLDGEVITHFDDNEQNYATLNAQEMFAECYVLMMIGECNSQSVIEQYFPESMAYVSKMLTEIRSLSPEQRHKK